MSLEFNIEVFDPKKEVLLKVVESVKDITADPTKITKDELALVSDTRKKLMRYRTDIQKAGKATRDEALQFGRDVIAYEKELIGIIEPEELRLKDIETKTREYAIREVRREKLPELMERLHSIGDNLDPGDEPAESYLLSMDPNQFEAYYNQRVFDKNEADRIALEEAEAKKKEEQEAEVLRVGEEQDKKAAELKAKEDEIENERKQLERDKELEKAKKEAQIQADKEAKEKVEREIKEAEEKAVMKKKRLREKLMKDSRRFLSNMVLANKILPASI